MRKKLLMSMFFFSLGFVFYGLNAQEKQVSGTVTSASDKLPMPGVSVVVKGTSRGVATDFDGNFTIKAKEGEILQFISMGFTSQEKKVTGGVIN